MARFTGGHRIAGGMPGFSFEAVLAERAAHRRGELSGAKPIPIIAFRPHSDSDENDTDA